MSKIFCKGCNKKHEDFSWRYTDAWYCSKFFKSSSYEFVPDSLKEDRKKYAKDLIQPFRRDSDTLSREFVEAYPEISQKRFTGSQIKNSKNIWGKN